MALQNISTLALVATNHGAVREEHERELISQHPVGHCAPTEDWYQDLIDRDRKREEQMRMLMNKLDLLETQTRVTQEKLDDALGQNRLLKKCFEEIFKRFGLGEELRRIKHFPRDEEEKELKTLIELLPKAKQEELENEVKSLMPESKSNWIVIALTLLGACVGAGAGIAIALATGGLAAPVAAAAVTAAGCVFQASATGLIVGGVVGSAAGGCAFGGLGYATKKCSTTNIVLVPQN